LSLTPGLDKKGRFAKVSYLDPLENNVMIFEMSPRHSRIVCTLGPASDDPHILEQMIRSGMNVARLNFSHGTHESQQATFNRLRATSKLVGREIAILQDLQGHKVRAGRVVDKEGLELPLGHKIRIGTGNLVTTERIGIDYEGIANFVEPGHNIYMDDGLIEVVVLSKKGEDLICEVIVAGTLKSRKGVIFPHSELEFPLINEKDLTDARFGVDLGVDMVAMSFVRSATEILEMRIRMGEWGVPDSFIIAKIEDRKGIEKIEEILHVADGILIARGDMGVTQPREQVPAIQTRIIQLANARGVPVITATQMLESMIDCHRPTRAEVTDVFDAIATGSDAVMLSGETASGRYPVQVVQEMDRICRVAEEEAKQRRFGTTYIKGKEGLHDRMAGATATLVKNMKSRCVIAFSLSGSTLRSLSSARLVVPVYGVVESERVSRQLQLHRGLSVITLPRKDQLSDLIDFMLDRLASEKIISTGDRVVVIASEIDALDRLIHIAKVYVID